MNEHRRNDLIDGLLAISMLTRHLAQQLAGRRDDERKEEQYHVKVERAGHSTCRIVRA